MCAYCYRVLILVEILRYTIVFMTHTNVLRLFHYSKFAIKGELIGLKIKFSEFVFKL